MKKKELETNIRHAFESIPSPSLGDDVKAACRPGKAESAGPIRPHVWWPALVAVAAAVTIVFTVAFQMFTPSPSGAWTVSLDVNPSIAVEVDDQESIVAVTALNDDAEAIIGDADYSGQDVAATVHALVASMVENGYLSEVANSVLVSVDSKDVEKAALMQAKLSREIEATLSQSGFAGAVMSQTLHSDKELAALAGQYGISTGKATLIEHIRSLDPLKTFEELATASINELNLLAERLQAEIQSTGTASAKAYIDPQEALRIAAEDAGADIAQLQYEETELDYERGRMCYEVEFVWNNTEYEYDLDAVTGEVLKGKQEAFDDMDDDTRGEYKNLADVTCVDVAEVKATVLTAAGVSETDVTEFDVEWETRNSLLVYEVEFETAGTEYKYIVHAETGEVLDSKTEADNDEDDDDEDDRPLDTTGWVPEDGVKATVLAHAGLTSEDVLDYECEADEKKGVAVYDIEFEANGMEYEYTVDAKTGEIVDSKQKTD